MLNIIGDAIWCILSGIKIGIMAFLKVLPLYNELGNIKEEIIACVIGVPTIVISIAFVVSPIIRFLRKIGS